MRKDKVIIKSVTQANYGFYKCIVRNKIGRDEHIIEVAMKGNILNIHIGMKIGQLLFFNLGA